MTRTLPGPRATTSLKVLVGSGDRIALFTAPVLVVGLVLNIMYPSVFGVGGPPTVLRAVSVVVLAAGVAVWGWSAALILTRVPRQQLITSGPYAWVKHPLYTAVSLLVLPWLGFLFDTWLGLALGVVMYTGVRIFAPAEEAALAKVFGPTWTAYARTVRLPWL